MPSIDDVRTVAHAATVLAYGMGGALVLAIIGAACEAAWPGRIEYTLTRAYKWCRKALKWLFGLFSLVLGWPVRKVARLVQALAVTYLHTYRADKVTGRHYRGAGRLSQPAGRHRFTRGMVTA